MLSGGCRELSTALGQLVLIVRGHGGQADQRSQSSLYTDMQFNKDFDGFLIKSLPSTRWTQSA